MIPSYTAEDAAAVQKTPLDEATLERALMHLIAHRPSEVFRRSVNSLRARARTNDAAAAILLKSYMIPSATEQKGGGKRIQAPGVRAVKYFKRCVAAVRSGTAHISDGRLRAEIEALKPRPSLDFEGWWRAAESLHCLAFLERAPREAHRLQDVYESFELDEQLAPLSTGSADVGRAGARIKSRLRTTAQRHW